MTVLAQDQIVITNSEPAFIAAMRIAAPVETRPTVLLEMDTRRQKKLVEGVEAEVDPTESDDPFLVLSFSLPDCKCFVIYKSSQDVPLENATCQHGNYLLLWTNSKEAV